MTDTLETTAQRIAEQGRTALLERLRPAFRDAAAKHSDVLTLSEDQIEQMVQRAADRADGLQWRRALAGVAVDQLGISLGEALSHPAVVRAQAILGVPSYEDGRSRLATTPEATPPVTPTPTPTSEREPEPEPPPSVEPAALPASPAPEPVATAAAATAVAVAPVPTVPTPIDSAPTAPTRVADPGVVRLAVIHLGGVANLAPGERDIELRVSHFGLDIVRGNEEPLGRLTWSDIRTLSVPPGRGLRRRRRDGRAHLIIHTDHGDASFEVPAVAPEELREHLAGIVGRHGRTLETR